jgi:small subunit ribosomal protein S4
VRYTGPKVKLSRRLGVNVFENEKGARALEKRPYPPGVHGNRRSGRPSDYALQLRETQKLRLDNVVFRAGWARTRPQARQFTSHGLLLVNSRRVSIPSIRLRSGDEVELEEKAQAMIVIRHNLDTLDVAMPAWLERRADGHQVRVCAEPTRDQIQVPANAMMVVELYSR